MSPVDHSARIAILDDEPEAARLLADMLESMGFEVAVFTAARAFLDARLHCRYQVLMLDLAMPDMDGVELMHTLAESERRETLILVSGLSKQVLGAARRIALDLGFPVLGALAKPFRHADLARVLNTTRRTTHSPVKGSYLPTEAELKRAIANAELRVHMQPQLRIRNRQWVGMEALVRWQHPVHGLIMPSAFITLAEDSGMAMAITEWVTRQAIQIALDTQAMHGYAGSVSVNLAPASLTDLQFPRIAESLALACGWPTQKICFEVTETSVARDPVLALEILTRLAIKGFRLALDDFGTGHSSLEKLQQLPLTELKIDMGFVRSGLQDERARVIVEESIVLGHKLGMQVVAEGVESATHLHWLTGLGCDVAQGYFVGQPVPAERVGGWFRP